MLAPLIEEITLEERELKRMRYVFERLTSPRAIHAQREYIKDQVALLDTLRKKREEISFG